MFRFTIRDVLWLTVVAGLIVALWLEHRALLQERENVTTLRYDLNRAHLYWDGEHEKYLELIRRMPPQPTGGLGGGRDP